ncbi:MAG: tRNA (adenosine(37)-N6)-threonylcarbamoyltransferase complex dimerization subunit type 1 TsaB, partial [Rhodospirillaceae bacterium]|nr:tRNA (adenosine(37)-N6)-threonylcarbamoyltransferase complex dimerization subunit type 1 TsaB [Rhodospirillaceae bacterium]
MPILAFDTTQGACSAAIADDGRLLSQRNEAMQRGHAEYLLPMIEAVRIQAGIIYQDLDLIAVTVGPGTFTGVRVGLAAARALALVHDIPVLGIGTLELLAQPAVTTTDGGIIAAIDARRGELYVQAFDRTGQPVTEATAGPVPSFVPPSGLLPGLLVGTGASLLGAALPNWRIEGSIVQPDAAVLARAAEAWRHRACHRPPSPLYL